MVGKEKKTSISKVFTVFQIGSLLILLLLISASYLILYIAQRRSSELERTYQMRLAVEEIGERMHTVEYQLKDVRKQIAEDYSGLWSKKDGEKCFDKLKLNRLLESKLIQNSEMDFLFAFRPEDFMVFRTCDGISIFERLAMKDYLEKNAEIFRKLDSDGSCCIVSMGGKSYFLECLYFAYADLFVGAASRQEKFLAEAIDLCDGSQGICTLSDRFGQSYTYQGTESQQNTGTIAVEAIDIGGGLTLKAEFDVSFLHLMQKNLILTVLMGLICCGVYIYFMNRLLHNRIIQPVQDVSEALQDLGDLTQLRQIPEKAQVEEIHHLETVVNTLLQNVVYSRMKLISTELQKKSQELRMLRAQLRPHFFLNAITTVSTMTYQNRGEEIRDYLVRLSSFLRYIMSSEDPMAPLGEELSNLENYFRLQEIRYPGRVVWFREDSDQVSDFRIPRYLLLTVGENAMKYGMRPDDILQILIQCRIEGDCVVITIEDNGPGFTPEQLRWYDQPELPDSTEEVHIGLSNIKRTLSLQYGRTDLLHLEQAVPSGAKIEIRIPMEQGESTEKAR
ncbi:MAG: histidine kinase [Firmicutes bacterium]|nr:histidine kinase [Bacillota bacterium]